MEKRLYRSNSNNVLGGVCGGLGEYFNVDPVLVRVLAVLLAFAHGFGLLGYIVAWIIIPRKPVEVEEAELRDAQAHAAQAGPGAPTPEPRYNGWTKYLPGLALVTLGVLMLVKEFFYWFSWSDMLPALLIVIGIVFLIASQRQRGRQQSDNAYQQQANGVNGDNGGNGGAGA